MDLHTQRLHLRELTAQDLDFIHELHSLPETDAFNTLGIPETKSVTELLLNEFIAAQHERPRKRYVLGIINEAQELTGLIGIKVGRPAYRDAEIWYKLHVNHWNKGYATEAVKAVISFGFETLHLHRITAGCATGNIASKRVLEKAGMTLEGHCRQLLPIRGEWMDNYEFAILESDPVG